MICDPSNSIKQCFRWSADTKENFVLFQPSTHPWNKTETKHWNSL